MENSTSLSLDNILDNLLKDFQSSDEYAKQLKEELPPPVFNKDPLKDYFDCLEVLIRDKMISPEEGIHRRKILNCYRSYGQRLRSTDNNNNSSSQHISMLLGGTRKDEDFPVWNNDASQLLRGIYFPFKTLLDLYLVKNLALIPSDMRFEERPPSDKPRFQGLLIANKMEHEDIKDPLNVVAVSPAPKTKQDVSKQDPKQ